MKMSLQELFDVNHPTLFNEFASQPTHTAYTWAVNRLKELIELSLHSYTPYESEIASLRTYRHKALNHYQGNLTEFYKAKNPEVRINKIEPQAADIAETTA